MIALAGSSAGAASRGGPRAPALQPLLDCKRVADAQLRLACFDKAVDALETAETRGDVVVTDRAQAHARRRAAFGAALSEAGSVVAGGKDETLTRLQTTLISAHQQGEGRWVMSTVDDHVWVQTDGQEIFRSPHAGSTLFIRKGALGGFFCQVDGQLAIRCLRRR